MKGVQSSVKEISIWKNIIRIDKKSWSRRIKKYVLLTMLHMRYYFLNTCINNIINILCFKNIYIQETDKKMWKKLKEA